MFTSDSMFNPGVLFLHLPVAASYVSVWLSDLVPIFTSVNVSNVDAPLGAGVAHTASVPLFVSTIPADAPATDDNALIAFCALVCPVPPLAIATVPVTLAALPEILPLT
ncbi:membrane protein [Candidatus Magnetobacterium bavaricum]|uniref:Membrane protein n=1 Tax=Candidatus Magnetobacterium bavaricum TaxID=29290 RepID=A0A0F3GP29_9BACT|nr:membrane protein [Candidatus Magnetobacterium bavaricum]